nr:TMV resistance protein N-like isoform X2 [Ipomoea batatas]
MECKEEFGQVVVPIFYDVEPSHVRKQTRSFAKSFAKHRKNFKDIEGKAKVETWRKALREAGKIVGHDLEGDKYNGYAFNDHEEMEGVLVTSRDRHSYNENINCLIEALKGMKKLKILIVEGYGQDFYSKMSRSEFEESFGRSIMHNYLPSSLRWLHFSYYNLFSLPESFHPSKLVGFHLPHSSLKTCIITKVIQFNSLPFIIKLS